MFIDEDRLAELSDKKVDVVIVGTGPAGISIALELESLNVDCLLIEAGGFDFPAKEELDPYEGEIIGRPYPLKSSRLRFFGGTSGHWGGWVKPLDEEDFNTWPVSYTEVYKYLPAAHKILEIDDVGYDGSSLTADKLIDTQDSKFFRTSNFQFSPPTRFGEKYRNRIKKSKKIYCALNTNLLQIKRDKDGVSTKLTVKTVSGSIQTIHGRAFVLAMGGIENPRYLLQSNLHLSNKYGTDHLGKCFMDHFALNTSLIYSKKGLLYSRFKYDNKMVKPVISPSRRLLTERKINNVMMDFIPTAGDNSLVGDNYIKNPGLFDPSINEHEGGFYQLITTSSNSPSPKSSVTLSNKIDINGINRVRLNWHIPDKDFRNIVKTVEIFANYLGQNGLGRLRKIQHSVLEKPSVGMHHMGTTRMSSSENSGVCDTNCKCFNSKNLFIAGSSVFPTAGYANPTLTIVCLSVRLANHINSELSNGGL